MKQYVVHFVSGAAWDVEGDRGYPLDGWWFVIRLDFKIVDGKVEDKLSPIGHYHIQMANVEAVKET